MHQTRPLISVVIPVFNGAPFVAKAVESVRSQTVQDVEIIVVNDGSTDGTGEVLAKLERSAGIMWLQHDHAGPSRSRNKGLEAASGKYFALLDCDDIWLPGKLEAQLAIMEKRLEVGVVHTDYEMVDGDGVVHERVAARFSQEPLVQAFAGGHAALPSTLLVRRDVMRSVGRLNPDLYGSEDSDLTIRLYTVTKFECVDRVLVRKLQQGHGYRDMFYDEITHREKVLVSRKRFLSGLEQMPSLTKGQRAALDREWANYFLRLGKTAEDLGRTAEALNHYCHAVKKDPFRVRVYTRMIRAMAKWR